MRNWEVDATPPDVWVVEHVDGAGAYVCSVHLGGKMSRCVPSPWTMEAAYLIAAAPDLLEACQAFVRLANAGHDWAFEPEALSLARAAIAKSRVPEDDDFE